jgi:cytochrome bd-type quinol oxidase subunit 2
LISTQITRASAALLALGGLELLWAIALPLTLFAAIYIWLLFRGPFERDFQSQARSR